ncbi:MBL fold metallo-hydrolase [Eikenella sp. S3360]|uniref:MBL fold metallo-hydrolase n=1 Tax=Eikenella glucosivorans TaxID=2766967 RepID=A0ABS0N6Z3_9NEIS|nr:MBL fold metallo-hydrolase [Eikenella glucosivorans]MBH5328088.1 MBL fold metallo-hydrolase [Eikenella glucosivorans]
MKFKRFIFAAVLAAAALSAQAGDHYQHIRNATAKVEYAGQTFLIDPFFAPKHAMNGFAGTFNSQAKIPLVGLPMDVNKILDGVDAVIVTHTHEDHWDEAAARAIPKTLPVYVQHEADAAKIRSQGFADVRVLNGTADFNGISLSKTGGAHGTEAMYADPQLAALLGDAMGVVLHKPGHKTAYIMGDTVWTADVNKALNTHKPDYLIMNTGYALIQGIPDSIIMGTADVLKASQVMPQAKIITVHMDTVNHTAVSRADMHKFVRGQGIESRVRIPADGESVKLD